MTATSSPYNLCLSSQKDGITSNSAREELVVGCLYYGEPQMPLLLKTIYKSFSASEYKTMKIYIVAWQGNLISHLKLYKFFNGNLKSDRLKLDADMTVSHNTLSLLQSSKDQVRVIYPIFDYITDMTIYGAHFVRKGLIVDARYCNQTFPDNLACIKVLSDVDIGIKHCIRPSCNQIYTFILHRIIKLHEERSLSKKYQYFKLIILAVWVNRNLLFRDLEFLGLILGMKRHPKNYKDAYLDTSLSMSQVISLHKEYSHEHRCSHESSIIEDE